MYQAARLKGIDNLVPSGDAATYECLKNKLERHEERAVVVQAIDKDILGRPNDVVFLNGIVKEALRKHEEEWVKKREERNSEREALRNRSQHGSKKQKATMLSVEAIKAEIEEYATEATQIAVQALIQMPARTPVQTAVQKTFREMVTTAIVANAKKQAAVAADTAIKRQVPEAEQEKFSAAFRQSTQEWVVNWEVAQERGELGGSPGTLPLEHVSEDHQNS